MFGSSWSEWSPEWYCFKRVYTVGINGAVNGENSDGGGGLGGSQPIMNGDALETEVARDTEEQKKCDDLSDFAKWLIPNAGSWTWCPDMA